MLSTQSKCIQLLLLLLSTLLIQAIHCGDLAEHVLRRQRRNTFTNNFGYGPYGFGPNNAGFDGFGFWKDKFRNSGLPPLYTWQSYRNYYGEFSVHKNRYGNPAPTDFEELQQERFGPFYNGVWGFVDHSPYWFG